MAGAAPFHLPATACWTAAAIASSIWALAAVLDLGISRTAEYLGSCPGIEV